MNIFSDPWIRTSQPSGEAVVSLSHLIGDTGYEVIDIIAPPMSRLAIIRLCMALRAYSSRYGAIDPTWFDLASALQVSGLSEGSTRQPLDIINMSDGNGVAWSPIPQKDTTDADRALALVTAYFCDRGGLKARMPGLPISAQCPLHVGMRVSLERGDSIGRILDNNPVNYDSAYQPPWVTGMSYPDHKVPQDDMELLLWPWRRIQMFDSGLTIVAGAPIDKTVIDPWVIDKASLKHMTEPSCETHEITALVLNQASPLACWVI
jgi:hypothetical protein